jgi:hypothetical protein
MAGIHVEDKLSDNAEVPTTTQLGGKIAQQHGAGLQDATGVAE